MLGICYVFLNHLVCLFWRNVSFYDIEVHELLVDFVDPSSVASFALIFSPF